MKAKAEKGDEVEHENVLGKVVKEGLIHVQYNEDWVKSHLVIRERGITLALHPTKKESSTTKSPVRLIMQFSSFHEVGIVIMPDKARRSRESKMFPFTVYKKTAENVAMRPYKIKKVNNNEIPEVTHMNEVILATLNGREMWEWASCIQWLGGNPKEEQIPLFIEASSTNNYDEHYLDACLLQNVILKMYSYKNLPDKPIKFEEVARIDIEQKHLRLRYANYPNGYFDNLPYDARLLFAYGFIDSESDSDVSVSSAPIENHSHVFGLFAYLVLVGSCVHVNEKCFEIIMSSNLYDISSQLPWKGNSPLSMLCEGDHNSSRNYMVQALFRQGYPNLERYYAGYDISESFSIFVAKPVNLYGVGNVVGGPVHPDDQKLCRYLRDKGDGKLHNENLSTKLIEACTKNLKGFDSEHGNKITKITIPKSVMNWGCNHLTKLDFSNNGIFELPEELYEFKSLTHLNVSRNCLFGLSHKLGNLTNLTYLNIRTNLIEELPYTMIKLDNISEFECAQNPITVPPSAIWSRGFASVKNFFKDLQQSGTEINLDLRVLVLGLSEAGKTSLINGLINPNTSVLTRVGDRTVGIEKRTWTMHRNDVQQPVNFLTYDFAGQEEYYITHHLFLGSKALYIIAFDLSKYGHGSIDKQIMLWWNSIQNRVCNVKSNDSKTPKIILVGTHADMVEDEQSLADEIYKELKNDFDVRTDNIKRRLENIEKELDNLDPRRKKGKYIKLANAEDAIEQGQKYYKMLSTQEKAQILSRENDIKKLRHEQQCTIALPSKIHPVSSKDLRNFDLLKEQISASLTEIGPSGKYFPHLDTLLPRSWFQVRRFVRQQSTIKGYECMTIPKYFKLLSEELDIDEDVGRRATKFCHELGDVLFFEKEDLVFLQPSFLIDAFKYVIRHDHQESTNWTKKFLDNNISEEKFNEGKKLLLHKGELELWLLEVLWSPIYDAFSGSSIMNNLIQLLETFDIGTFVEKRDKRILSIPEFQPKHLSERWLKQKNDGDYEIERWITVDQKLPHGLLKRIQVRIFKRVFKRNGVKDYNLAQNEIHIIDKSLTELFCMTGKRTDECPGVGLSEGLRLCVRGKDKECAMSLFSKVYSCVENTLNDYPGLTFNHYVAHTIQSGSLFMKLEEIKALKESGKKDVHFSAQIVQHSTAETEAGKNQFSLKPQPEQVVLNIDDLLPPTPIKKNILPMQMDGPVS